jgi:hypothetical protein
LLGVNLFAYLIALLAFSSFSYFAIEKRFSHISLSKTKSFLFLYVLPVFFIGSVSVFTYLSKGIPQRYSEDVLSIVNSYDGSSTLSRECSLREQDVDLSKIDLFKDSCLFHKGEGKASVLLMGDSHANHMTGFVSELLKETKLSATYNVQGGCYASEGVSSNKEGACAERNRYLLNKTSEFDYVVLGGAWDDAYYNDLEYFISKAKSKKPSITIILFKDVYKTIHEEKCAAHNVLGWSDGGCSSPVDLEVKKINDNISRLENLGVTIIEPNESFCNMDYSCLGVINNKAIYRDSNHINNLASREMGKVWLESNKNPFTSNLP